ncbi:hypothetical protein GCM10022290_15630 [Sagittula marina]
MPPQDRAARLVCTVLEVDPASRHPGRAFNRIARMGRLGVCDATDTARRRRAVALTRRMCRTLDAALFDEKAP